MLTAALSLGGVACDSNPVTEGGGVPPRVMSATNPAVEPGQEAVTPHFAMSVRSSRPCTVEAHLKPPEDVAKFAVEVELRALGEAEVPAGATGETGMRPGAAAAAEGQEFESTLAGCRPLLTAQRLKKPQSARGWITFDIPETARPASLIYRPVIIGTGSEKVELLLGH